MFKSVKEAVAAFGGEDNFLNFVNSANKNREYRKGYNMKKQAVAEMVKKDPRFAEIEKAAAARVASQLKNGK